MLFTCSFEKVRGYLGICNYVGPHQLLCLRSLILAFVLLLHPVYTINFRTFTVTVLRLDCAKTCKRISTVERSVVDSHCIDITAKCTVGIKGKQEIFLRYIGYLSFTNDLIKHVLLQIRGDHCIVQTVNFMPYCCPKILD